MTFTPRDLALASIAAPEPESRLTSSSTLAPLVIICSACCCCVDLSPSAFWMSASTPASANAFFRNGRSTVSQRTEDLESGSRTPTLPALAAAVAVPLVLLEPELLSSLPHAVTTSAAEAASKGMSRVARFIGPPPPGGHIGTGTVDAERPQTPGDGDSTRRRELCQEPGRTSDKTGAVASDPERS